MIPVRASPGSNDLLAALPPRERERVLKSCERVSLQRDEILSQPGEPLLEVHFPLESFISLQVNTDQHSLGLALIGSEGMLGASLLLGSDRWSVLAQVQGPGSALRMPADDLLRTLATAPALERQLRFYLHRQFTQLEQVTACITFHVVEQRLAGWLLMAHERAHADRFYLTHDRLAHLLGVRRSGVTTAAGLLQSRKLIGYTRGHITILNRKGLEATACGCYQSLRDSDLRNAVAERARPQLEQNADLPFTPAPMPMDGDRGRRGSHHVSRA